MTPTYHVRTATADDYEALVALRVHAEDWLRKSGVEQWLRTSVGEENIREQIEVGTMYAVTTATGEVVGCLALDIADPDFWTERESHQPAWYLYKFILHSEHRGLGLGDVLLDWACYRAELSHAIWLRLDCWRTNTKLHRYYIDRGFTHKRTVEHPTRKSGALFERWTEIRLVQQPRVHLMDDVLGEEFTQQLASTSQLVQEEGAHDGRG